MLLEITKGDDGKVAIKAQPDRRKPAVKTELSPDRLKMFITMLTAASEARPGFHFSFLIEESE